MPKPKRAAEGMIPKLLYRRNEAAFALGVSVREIDRLISDRELTTRRYKRCVLIPASDIRKLADTIMRSDMLPVTASERQ